MVSLFIIQDIMFFVKRRIITVCFRVLEKFSRHDRNLSESFLRYRARQGAQAAPDTAGRFS